jgi:hypothetical protein
VLGDQQLDGVVHQPVCLSLVDGGQRVAPNGTELAADPGVGPARVGVNAVDDELLSVAEKLEPVDLATGTWCDQ